MYENKSVWLTLCLKRCLLGVLGVARSMLQSTEHLGKCCKPKTLVRDSDDSSSASLQADQRCLRVRQRSRMNAMNMSSYCQKSAQTFLSMRNPVFGCRMPQCITFLQQPEVPASFTNKTRALLHQDLVKSGPKHSRKHRSGTENYERQACQPSVINVRAIALALAPVCVLLRDAPALALTIHQEPENALSLPTWVIHISSVVEWAIAMALVWKYAQVTGGSVHTAQNQACTG